MARRDDEKTMGLVLAGAAALFVLRELFSGDGGKVGLGGKTPGVIGKRSQLPTYSGKGTSLKQSTRAKPLSLVKGSVGAKPDHDLVGIVVLKDDTIFLGPPPGVVVSFSEFERLAEEHGRLGGRIFATVVVRRVTQGFLNQVEAVLRRTTPSGVYRPGYFRFVNEAGVEVTSDG